jgi:hypothetical protein
MNNGQPGNYFYNNEIKKRRWVSAGNPRVMAIHNMNGTTQVYDSPLHSERGEDVENGEETVPSEKQQNEINQSQTFTGIVVPNDNVVMERDEVPLKPKHKKRKKHKKKRSVAITANPDGDNITDAVPPHQLPPLTATTEPA